MFDVPQSSTLSTWYTGIIIAPLAGGKFAFDLVPPVELTKRTGVLYRVTDCIIEYNVDYTSLSNGFSTVNPLSVQLSITPNKGELILANKIVIGSNNPFPLSAWRKAKNDNEPLYVICYGEVDANNPALLGVNSLSVICKFKVETISDRNFLANFSKGCI